MRSAGEDWLAATAGLAAAHRKAGQHRRAIELLAEYLATDKAAWVILDAAESHLAVGERHRAHALVDEAEAASAALKKSTNQFDVRALARIEKRVKDLRSQLDATKR